MLLRAKLCISQLSVKKDRDEHQEPREQQRDKSISLCTPLAREQHETENSNSKGQLLGQSSPSDPLLRPHLYFSMAVKCTFFVRLSSKHLICIIFVKRVRPLPPEQRI